MKNKEQAIGLTANFGRDTVALQSVHAQGEVDGLLLRMKLRQVYRNTTGRELETVYSFPLAWGTTLLGLRVELNGKALNGSVIERSAAEARYEQAIEEGDLPVMLVREGKNLYSARLGNLKPGDEAVIEIHYGQLLVPEGGHTRIVVPTTIAPRYGRDPGLQGMSAHALGAVDPLAEYPFFLSLELHGPLARGRIACPSHTVSQQTTARGTSVQLAQQAMLDRDFLLTIATDDIASAVASPDPGEEAASTLLCSVVPRLPVSANETALRLKMLVDCSGSMVGDSMVLARAALAAVVGQLRADDAVSYSRFGSETMHLLDRLTPASPGTIARLRTDIRHTDADLGGTELEQALKQVIALRDHEDKPAEAASILLITDGETWNIDAIVATARQSGHQVYVIGVGSSPAESLVRELAEVTGGAAEFAAPGEDMSAAAKRLVAKMRSMRVFDITAELDGEALPLSGGTRRCAAGDTINLWFPLSHRPAKAPQIGMTDRRSGARQTIVFDELAWQSDSDIARIGAAQRLLDMTDPDLRRELALRYQLLSAETNYLLVHERDAADKAAGMPALQPIRSMLAAGWGGSVMVKEIPARYDVPQFLRRQADVDDPADTTSSARSYNSVPMFSVSCISEAPTRVRTHRYTSLAQALAHLDKPDNPLRELAEMMSDLGDTPVALTRLIAAIEHWPNFALLKAVFEKVVAIAGSHQAAMLILLDWLSGECPVMFAGSGGFRQMLVNSLPQVPISREHEACAYLDAEAARPPEKLRAKSDRLDGVREFWRRLRG